MNAKDFSLKDLAPPNVRAIAPYVPGKPIAETARELGIPEERILKMASNENPLGPSPKAVAAIHEALGDLNYYPDGSGYDPEITVEAAWRLPSSVRKAQSIEQVLKGSDFVTVHVPLVPRTRNLLDAARLSAARKGLVLLNFSRDAVVDEDAVVDALAHGRLGRYVTDFPSARLHGNPGVLALPHLGASTEEAEENCAVMVVDQLRDFLEHGTIRNAVNFPSVDMARESDHRIAISNANVPNMLGQISTTMAQAGLNIHNMVNKSLGEMAYTLVDLDSAAAPEVVERIGRIPGVLSVRSVPGAEAAA